jgi:hypothetical protein
MAYIPAMLTEEEKKKAEAAGGGQPTSGVIDPMAGANPGATAPGAADARPAPTPGTGFVNLQQYLDQNKDEGGRLAKEANKGITQAADQFSNKVQQVAQAAPADFTKANGADTAATLAQDVQKDASGAKDAAIDFLGKGYAGPSAESYTAGLASEQADLADKALKAGDSANVQTALKDTFGKGGNYSSGFATLDNFLIGGTDSGRKALGDVSAKALQTQNDLNYTQSQLTSAEKAAKDALEANKQKVLTSATGTKDAILSDAEKRAAALNSTLDPKKVGASQASLGDALDDTKTVDLQALTEIIRASEDPDWYKKTFNAGRDAFQPTGPGHPLPETSTPGDGRTKAPGSMPDQGTDAPDPEKVGDPARLGDKGVAVVNENKNYTPPKGTPGPGNQYDPRDIPVVPPVDPRDLPGYRDDLLQFGNAGVGVAKDVNKAIGLDARDTTNKVLADIASKVPGAITEPTKAVAGGVAEGVKKPRERRQEHAV